MTPWTTFPEDLEPGDPAITNGTPTSIIRWGNDTPQSGYDFNAADPLPPPFQLPGPASRSFLLGRLCITTSRSTILR